LELGQRVPDRSDLLRRELLEQRHHSANRLDRESNLTGVALALGPRRHAGPAHPEVDERDHVLEQHVLDPDLLDLGLVGCPQLFLCGRLPF
jgi:hypothetical protein